MNLEIKEGLSITGCVELCHGRSKNAGWWDGAHMLTDAHGQDHVAENPENINMFAAKIALIHSEVSEMLEGLRKGIPDDHLPNRPMEEVECADILVRVFDYAGARGMDLEGAFLEKLAYNANRADHKKEAREADGGKKI